ncbi:ammonium transporter [Geminocystis sp. NIES-3708]|uniref:ammonium transporter n=1 Tax=Geminocystis sp. NIES-3708 TaxID=1615909 RepID=UPI0005FC81FC|nr:ammonium transporter [Geminocystis sp. NIES-3708]BAQ62343.1 ammonium transporter [Geminocystis sp. NIES-3708]
MFKSKTKQKKIKLIIQKIKQSSSWQGCLLLSVILLLSSSYAVYAQEPSQDLQSITGELRVGLDTLWVVLASILVIFMNAGFAMLETGFCRRKNAVNLLSKNLIVFAVSTIAFWAIGFSLMFGDGNSIMGLQGFFLNGIDNSPATGDAYKGVYSALNWTGVPLAAKFLFQVAFAGTAATIVSGAVAERIKFIDFVLFSFLLVAIAYPIVGHWIWGGGWLQKSGFQDFAGSTVVHSVGGWAALTGAIILGPRLGKYQKDGGIIPLPGHNLSIATLGCFILWIGWFGFNPGSTMAVGENIAYIAVVTNLAAASGAITATVSSWVLAGKPDLSLSINGILSGLVAITASCSMVSYGSAVTIGALAGILVVFAVYLLDSLKIDDPVGAVSVHLVNGIWGTIALGLFADANITKNPDIAGLFSSGSLNLLGIQLLGIVSVGVVMIIFSTLVWNLLKVILGLRVSEEEEYLGLDIGEHGMEAYNGFLEVDN